MFVFIKLFPSAEQNCNEMKGEEVKCEYTTETIFETEPTANTRDSKLQRKNYYHSFSRAKNHIPSARNPPVAEQAAESYDEESDGL